MVLWIITNYRHFVRPTVLSILHLNKTRDNKCNCSIGMERLLVTMKVAPNQILKTSSLAESEQKVGMMALLSAKHCTNYCQTINLQSN